MSKASHRRRLREALVQVLYSFSAQSTDESEEEALDLILESHRHKALVARCRAVLHLQQGRGKPLAALEEVVRQTFRLEIPDEGENPLLPVRDLAKAETRLQEGLDSLRRELDGNKNPLRLQELLDACTRANHDSRNALARLTTPRPSLPAVESTRGMTLELASGLPRYAERLRQSLSQDPPDLPELAALRKALAATHSHREEVSTRLHALREALPEIDEAIASCLDNYAPERLDRVDRAILRLGTFELRHTPDVPPAVVINEAIELAREFGSTDSARFVNGILDRIQARSPSSQSGDTL